MLSKVQMDMFQLHTGKKNRRRNVCHINVYDAEHIHTLAFTSFYENPIGNKVLKLWNLKEQKKFSLYKAFHFSSRKKNLQNTDRLQLTYIRLMNLACVFLLLHLLWYSYFVSMNKNKKKIRQHEKKNGKKERMYCTKPWNHSHE